MASLKQLFLVFQLIFLPFLVHCTKPSQFVDLSHPQNSATIYWPTHPTFSRSSLHEGKNAKGVWVSYGSYSSGEHGGTHVDVPLHFIPGGLDLKDFPLERTIGDGVLINCSSEAEKDMDYAVTVEKLLDWEAQHGRIPYEAAVLFCFGYAAKFSDPTAYFNTQEINNSRTFHFPHISREAAKWLQDKRSVKMLGTDAASPDDPHDPDVPVHVMLLSGNVLLLENMNIPTSLPLRNFRVYAPPIRIENGTGVQTRMFAMLYDPINNRGVSFFSYIPVFVLSGFIIACIVRYFTTSDL